MSQGANFTAVYIDNASQTMYRLIGNTEPVDERRIGPPVIIGGTWPIQDDEAATAALLRATLEDPVEAALAFDTIRVIKITHWSSGLFFPSPYHQKYGFFHPDRPWETNFPFLVALISVQAKLMDAYYKLREATAESLENSPDPADWAMSRRRAAPISRSVRVSAASRTRILRAHASRVGPRDPGYAAWREAVTDFSGDLLYICQIHGYAARFANGVWSLRNHDIFHFR